tara:strand:- start:1099 stop:3141 length:2043 start_codon:yes stop_codon:yes gene_type:complete
MAAFDFPNNPNANDIYSANGVSYIYNGSVWKKLSNSGDAILNSDLDGKGELLVGNGSGIPSALPVGPQGTILKANSSTSTGLEWSTESSGESNQNAFSAVAVSGQPDVILADTTTDTLNFAAGNNVTITTNAQNDTITISSSGSGGGSGGLNNVVEDLTPELGGDLDGLQKGISNVNTLGIRDIMNGQIGHIMFSGYTGGPGPLIKHTSNGDIAISRVYGGGGSYYDSFVFGRHIGPNLSKTPFECEDSIISNGFVNIHTTLKQYLVTVVTKTSAHRYYQSGSTSGYQIQDYTNKGFNAIGVPSALGRAIEAPFLYLVPGTTYRFDQSHSTNAGHQIAFYLEANKTTQYTTGVTTVGTPGQAGAYTEITVTDTTPTILHYQCVNHSYMGNCVTTNSNVVNYNDLLNQPTIPTNNNQLTNGANYIDGSALNAANLSSGTIPDARFPATLPAVSGANLTNISASDATKMPLTGGTFTGDVKFGDNDNAIFGDDGDLKIYHSGIASYISDLGNGVIKVTTDGFRVRNALDNENMIKADQNGAVELYYDNVKKLETTSTGVTVTGDILVSGGGTFTGEVIFQKEITETVFTITDGSSVDLDPSNGTIQTWILGANRTVSANNFSNGQSLLLIVTATATGYTLTWPNTMKWVGGSEPTLGGADPTAIELFYVGSTLYGATVGDLS